MLRPSCALATVPTPLRPTYESVHMDLLIGTAISEVIGLLIPFYVLRVDSHYIQFLVSFRSHLANTEYSTGAPAIHLPGLSPLLGDRTTARCENGLLFIFYLPSPLRLGPRGCHAPAPH